MNSFIYSDSNKRYHTLNFFYKKKFNSKVFKVSLNAGFTCPNIDGSKGYGGCIYCLNGSGDEGDFNLVKQFNEVKTTLHKKWPTAKYIGYFQANSNTYDSLDNLKEKYESILSLDNVIGLSIATRPDAISDEVIEYLDSLNKRTFLTVELGLQTIHESTAKLINRCHDLICFEEMLLKLKTLNINVVVHIINGLPYETKEMMLETIKYLNSLPIDGVKIHMLSILKGTALSHIYEKEKFHILNREEYIEIVCDQLENLNPKIVINRITGDPKEENLVEPNWLTKKFGVLNEIDKELVRRNTYQGFNLSILNQVKRLIDLNIKNNDIVIDATIGNGNDTLYLCKKVNNGFVFGFDIQSQAIKKTQEKLNGLNNFKLYQDNFTNMFSVLNSYENKISLIIYNLGYLPGGDKSITTRTEDTIKSIKEGLKLLNKKGFILIVVYPGHHEGLIESNEIKKIIFGLTNYTINEYHNTNNDKAPYLIEIKRKEN